MVCVCVAEIVHVSIFHVIRLQRDDDKEHDIEDDGDDPITYDGKSKCSPDTCS